MNDIKVSENGFDLAIENGDFISDFEATEQHLQFLTLANKGEFRETPQLGVGIVDYINSKDTTAKLKREIQIQADLDGFAPSEIKINLPEVTIKGTY